MEIEKIDSFKGDYEFLSNFYESPVTYNGLTFRNSEAAFQAQKCAMPAIKERFVNMSASQAKKYGRQVLLRRDWELVKDDTMYEVVRAKFTQNKGLAEKLLATGNAYLEEGNNWNDTYWGTVYGVGQNKLGKILMQVREELRQGGF